MGKRTCNVEGCEQSHAARGLCKTHYSYEQRHGRLALHEREKGTGRACSVDRCQRVASSWGMCSGHYKRWKADGDVRADVPLREYQFVGLTAAEIIRRCVEVRGPDECWPWTGWIDKKGYGGASYGGNIAAHRLAFLVANGRLPAYSVDHTCHDARTCVPYGRGSECPHRRCCNPAHLADIPLAQNSARQGDYPTCPHGHTWTPENTIIKANGYRACRECERKYW